MPYRAKNRGCYNVKVNRKFLHNVDKKVKISNFELQTCLIPQMKAENMQNSYSGRKSRIWNKKVTFLTFLIFMWKSHPYGSVFEKVVDVKVKTLFGNFQPKATIKSWSIGCFHIAP